VIYFDTSALIKNFILEQGSKVVQDLVRNSSPVATASIAYAEVYSGLTRKRRERLLTVTQHVTVCRQFEEHWASYIHVELAPEVLILAKDLIQRHPLRAFDAIHLASALVLQKGIDQALQFAAGDARLLQAATSENLISLNVES